jgi:hypothetical protein
MVVSATRRRLLWSLTLSIVLVFTLSAVSSRPARADSGDLPPRPTPEPITTSSPIGSYIRLHVAFPEPWPWTTRPWQTTLTQVQWQTGEGDWIDVTGWYGAIDDVAIDTERTVTGTKTWWVAPRDYGTGPFRWLVTNEGNETPLAVSKAFTLPVRSGSTLDIAVSLPELHP